MACLISPALKDEALLADLAAALAADAGALTAAEPGPLPLRVWWLGQSGFLLQWAGQRLLFDPYLSDSLTQKYAMTDKPHVRMMERCVDPAQLTGVSVATGSHVHTDHLDAETLVALAKSNPGLQLYVPHPIVPEAVKRLGAAAAWVQVHGLSDGEVLRYGPWTLQGVVAKHNEIVRDAAGRSAYIGYIVSCGPFTVYHSGDTLWDEALVETLCAQAPKRGYDVAFLPINGNLPERRVAGNLNGTEAAELARAARVRLAVPCHYEMFEFNTASPHEFTVACARLGQPYHVLRCGERLELEAAQD